MLEILSSIGRVEKGKTQIITLGQMLHLREILGPEIVWLFT